MCSFFLVFAALVTTQNKLNIFQKYTDTLKIKTINCFQIVNLFGALCMLEGIVFDIFCVFCIIVKKFCVSIAYRVSVTEQCSVDMTAAMYLYIQINEQLHFTSIGICS